MHKDNFKVGICLNQVALEGVPLNKFLFFLEMENEFEDVKVVVHLPQL